MMNRDFLAVAKILWLLIFATLLNSCGQKGPLVLPTPDTALIVTETDPSGETEYGLEEESRTTRE